MKKLIQRKIYGVVPSELLNADNISLKAKGLYAYIQSRAYGWEIDAVKIASKIKEDEGSVQSAINELLRHRYLEIVKVALDNGDISEGMVLHESPAEKTSKKVVLESSKEKDKFDFKKCITNLVGVQYQQEINDFLLVRKRKGATNSKTAFNILRNEIDKSRRLPIEVVRICIEKDWKGFKAEWLNEQNKQNGKTNIGVDRKVVFDKA